MLVAIRFGHSVLRVCCRKKCSVVFYIFSLPPGVYVGALNLIELIPGPSILTFQLFQKYPNRLALCILWTGVMNWSLGLESWSGILECILGVKF